MAKGHQPSAGIRKRGPKGPKFLVGNIWHFWKELQQNKENWVIYLSIKFYIFTSLGKVELRSILVAVINIILKAGVGKGYSVICNNIDGRTHNPQYNRHWVTFQVSPHRYSHSIHLTVRTWTNTLSGRVVCLAHTDQTVDGVTMQVGPDQSKWKLKAAPPTPSI